MRLKIHETKKARIEIIPMIDVVFFLLVFSLLAALNMARLNRLQADVPKTGGATKQANRVTVNAIHGKLFLTYETPDRVGQQTLKSASEIRPALAAEFRKNPGLVVLVNAQDTMSFEKGAALVDAVKGSGAPLVIPAGG
jgi:biopolymer transport protein ExbD